MDLSRAVADFPEIVLFQSFLAIAQTQSLTLAAEMTHRSQPTISQHLKRLETLLGVSLVSRKQRPLILTPEGEILLSKLPIILGNLHTLINEIQSTKQIKRKSLRIAMPDSMSSAMGAEFVSIAGRLANSVELCAGIGPWERNVFRTLQVDLLVDTVPFDPKGYAHPVDIFVDPYVLIAPARTKGRSLESILTNEPQVAHANTSKFGKRASRITASLGVKSKPKYNFDSIQSIMRFVEIGYGWSVTSILCLYQNPSMIKNIEIHPLDAECKRELVLLSRDKDLAGLADETVRIMQLVSTQLINGPWAEKSETAASLMRAANPDLFSS